MGKYASAAVMETLLVLTGERQQGRYGVQVQGGVVPLTYGNLTALLDLLVARGSSEAGFWPVDRLVIARLRTAIDAGAGPGVGATLIETGCGEEYRLAIPAEQLATRVLISPGFWEMAQRGVLTQERCELLRKICGSLKPA